MGLRKGECEDITGQVFVYSGVTAIKFVRLDHNRQAKWIFECNRCGEQHESNASYIKQGRCIPCKCQPLSIRKQFAIRKAKLEEKYAGRR